MAFSFDNLINKIKQQFRPKTYINTDTGEVIKKRIYNQLSEEEKQVYISAPKFDEVSKLPTVLTQKDTTNIKSKTTSNTTQIPKHTQTSPSISVHHKRTYVDNKEKERQRIEDKFNKQREREERRLNKIEQKKRESEEQKRKRKENAELDREERKRKKDYIDKVRRENKKRTKALQKAEKERKQKYEKAVKKWEKKHKTYDDVKPPTPPKDIDKELAKNMQKPIPIIDNIEALKKEIEELERKTYPIYDLSGTRSYLLGIVEDMETYYEGSSEYSNYLKENEEEIAELLWVIQYESKDQEKIDTAITQLATLLNMGTLSALQQDDLDYIHDNYGWSDE